MGCGSLIFKILNPIMKAILKSPFHSMISSRIMIITFQGRVSGRQFSTPVSYYQEDNTVVCFTHANWWRNIEADSKVRVRIRGQDYEGMGKAIPDDIALMTSSLYKLLKAVPSDAGFYNVKLNEDQEPIMDDVKKAVSDAVMIQVELVEE
jgi:hypothetical protein